MKIKGFLYIGSGILLVLLFRTLQQLWAEEILKTIPSLLQLPLVIILYGLILIGVPLLIIKGVRLLKD